MEDPFKYIKESCCNKWPTKDHDFYPSGWYLSNDGMRIMVSYVGGGSGVILTKERWQELDNLET